MRVKDSSALTRAQGLPEPRAPRQQPHSWWGRGVSASAPDAPSQMPLVRPQRPFAAVSADAKSCRAVLKLERVERI